MMDNSKPPDPACKYFLSQFACAKAFVYKSISTQTFKLQKQMLKVMGLYFCPPSYTIIYHIWAQISKAYKKLTISQLNVG